jgi:hypothetical protein
VSDSESEPTQHELEVEEALERIFEEDPWVRFDLWSHRAWGAAENAMSVAEPNVGNDENLDPRIIAAFHASNVAQKFAEMVNPIAAMYGNNGAASSQATAEQTAMILAAIIEKDELE